MKAGFESKISQVIVVNLDNKLSEEVLYLAEMVTSAYQATHLFESEDTDYMFSTIVDFAEGFYQKSTKSYE